MISTERHFLFEETNSNENFIVCMPNLHMARIVASRIGDDRMGRINKRWNVRYICELSDDEAEASGLDEY